MMHLNGHQSNLKLWENNGENTKQIWHCSLFHTFVWGRLHQVCVERWGDVSICGNSFYIIVLWPKSSLSRSLLENVLSSPIKHIESSSKHLKWAYKLFCKNSGTFSKSWHFHQTFPKQYFKMCLKLHWWIYSCWIWPERPEWHRLTVIRSGL